jgi:hypothetical protein
MRLLFAYTGKGLINSASGIPNGVINVWQQAGNTPFVYHQSTSYAIQQAAGDELSAAIGYSHIFARSFDLLGRLSADEVLTWGFRYRGTYDTVNASPLAGLLVNDPRQGIYPVLWSDGGQNGAAILDLFIEVTADPVARTVTGYINGRKTRTLPIPDTVLWNEVNLGYLLYHPSSSATKTFNHFYSAVFKKSEGVTHLSAWECEECVELSNEMRDGGGALTNNTVNEAWKSVVYKAPTVPLDEVAADLTGINPQLYSTLMTELSDGTTTKAYSPTSIGALINNTEFSNNTSGKPLAWLSPSKLATQYTLKLKALPPQE